MSKRSLLAWVLGLCAVSACAPAVVLLPPSRAGFLEPVPAQLAPEAVAPTVAQVAPSAPGIGPANDPNAALDQAGGELDQGALPPDPEPNAKAGEPTPEADTDTDPQALRRFRSDLDPYGEWIDDARYGTVWVPYPNVVGVHFEPYLSGGHWSVSPSNQWLWVSDYPFGGVVFHYGRWVWISGEGWAWVAGNHYAPAWVHFWTTSDGYYGWAPLGPMHVWRAGAVVWITCPSPRPRVFIARRHIYAHTPSEHRVTNSRQLHELGQHARSSTLRAPAEASSQAVPSRTQTVSSKSRRTLEPGHRTVTAGAVAAPGFARRDAAPGLARPGSPQGFGPKGSRTHSASSKKPTPRTSHETARRRPARTVVHPLPPAPAGIKLAPRPSSGHKATAKPPAAAKTRPAAARMRSVPAPKIAPRRVVPPPRHRPSSPPMRRRKH